MSEKKLSLFELHFHDSVQFGPRTIPGLGGDSDEETGVERPAGLPSDEEPPVLEDEPIAGDEGDESGPCIGCKLLGLGVLGVAAYAIRKLLGGEPSGLDALDDIEAGAEDDSSGSAGTGEAVSVEVTSGEESESSSGSKGLAAAAAVALLVVLAIVARKLLGDAVEELEVPEELAEE